MVISLDAKTFQDETKSVGGLPCLGQSGRSSQGRTARLKGASPYSHFRSTGLVQTANGEGRMRGKEGARYAVHRDWPPPERATTDKIKRLAPL